MEIRRGLRVALFILVGEWRVSVFDNPRKNSRFLTGLAPGSE
jgi:hypothetical protein